LISLLALCSARTKWYELADYSFEKYEAEFGKVYIHKAERQLRKELVEKRLEKIRSHNRDPTKSWKEGVNHLTDRTEKELKALRGGIPNHVPRLHPDSHLDTFDAKFLEAQNVDWREKGIVSAVKDQGDCGSCWSFASAEVVESYFALLNGELSDLSEQQILDCTPNPDECGGTGGCEGGTAELAFARIMHLGGLSSEWTYPYTSYSGKNEKCRFDPTFTPPIANISSYHTLPQNKYLPLLNHVATKGPIAISVDASSWSSYASGVFDGCNQTNPDIDHAVVLVGYGVDPVDGPYWLVRNSWSAQWGEKGYIRLKRTSDEEGRCGEDLNPGDGDGCKNGPPEVKVCGTCAILYDTCYPVVSSPK